MGRLLSEWSSLHRRSLATKQQHRNMADSAAKHETDELYQKAKRAKSDNENGGGEVGKEIECGNILSEFKTTKVLSDSAREKNIFIHGKVT